MAIIAGDGSQANPWIVDNWTDFLAVNVSANRDKYVQFKSPHKDYTSGTITLSGDGSYQNPKVVSSYEELLFATGATEVWQPKLVDDDNHDNLYYYKADNAETGTYCLYDSSLSTIDFNNLYPSGMSSNLYLESRNDFNGWTLLNMRFVNAANNHYDFFSENDNSHLQNVRILNYQSLACYPFRAKIIDSVIQGEINSTYSTNYFTYGSETNRRGIYRSSVNLKINCGDSGSTWQFSSTNGFVIQDSNMNLNIEAYRIGKSDYTNNNSVVNSTITGKFKSRDSHRSQIINSVTNSILDFESEATNAFPTPYYSCAGSVFNNEKLSITKTGLTGVTSAQLLSPTALQAAGLSIGVDT